MNTQEVIDFISNAKKTTPVKVYVKERPGASIDYGSAKVFGAADKVVFGEWDELAPLLQDHADAIEDFVVEADRRNTAVPLLDLKPVNARIVLGGRAVVGKHCHIGAGTVLAGVIEPASATPVVVEDDVLIGANAVVLEGVRVGKNSVVAAGAVVIEDVPEGVVVAGCPARVIKQKDERTAGKTALVDALRSL